MIPKYIINFDTGELPKKYSDFLIIGSGIAGLYTALEASSFGKVTVLTKKKMGDTNTERAQGGIAAAIHSTDSPALHRADTLEAGAGLCNVDAVEVLVNDGPDRVRELIGLGANFDRLAGELAFTREAAHSRRRILHAGDSTGEVIHSTLAKNVLGKEKIEFLEDTIVVDLLTDGNRCFGALVLNNKTNQVTVHYSKVTVLASGGAGRVFRNTTNPEVATGDGLALAFRAGATLMDLEFVQFHPTALCLSGAPRFLISEAVRGEGAVLRNIHGERFMPRYHPGAELASRDVVARAIFSEMERTDSTHVYLDLSPMAGKKVKKRFPTISRTCAQYGIDIATEMIPVAPAAHYMMGGVKTDLNGATSIAGLYACGEAACQGVHGANRLASNSLLDGLVFGYRIVETSQDYLNTLQIPEGIRFKNNTQQPKKIPVAEIVNKIQDVMWSKVGIVRQGCELAEAFREIEEYDYILSNQVGSMEDVEACNIVIAAMLITQSAIVRTESRGGHFRTDFLVRDDVHWKKHTVLDRTFGGDISADKIEVS